ncbi:MAG: DUF4154 domain-containing protein [Bacteroidetes bacterium]|nr:DUF4154 domain-containing protein [Bacteroidota bacterium]MBU1718944.1 DUF4154 domain-containing protein [Bacteroidota bacterium]
MRIRFLRRKIFIALGCLVFLLPQVSKAQFDNKSRSEYILDILKYVYWTNEKEFSEFKIGICSPDTLLVNELNTQIAKKQVIRDKLISVFIVNGQSSALTARVLFVRSGDPFEIEALVDEAKGKHILVISEGFDFHLSMINFIFFQGHKRFEMNEDALSQGGLIIKDQLFKAQAVKTRADWQEIYRQTEKKLDAVEKTVAEQKTEIRKQNELLEEQKTKIAAQKQEMAEQEQRIAIQSQELDQLTAAALQKENEIEERIKLLIIQKAAMEKQQFQIAAQEKKILGQKDVLASLESNITEQRQQIAIQKKDLKTQLSEIQKQQLIIWLFVLIFIIFVIFAIYLRRNYVQKMKTAAVLREMNSDILVKNREITRQNEEIEKQRAQVVLQRDQITLQKKHITDSIRYAEQIQMAVFPEMAVLKRLFPASFVLFRPKDIVSGDFYWVAEYEGYKFIAAADCTGHGVPGGFMSMMGITFLNEIINHQHITSPAQILDKLRKNIVRALKQYSTESEVRDGMDITLLRYEEQTETLQFAGANNSLYLLRNGECMVYKADSMTIAISDEMNPFNGHEIKLEMGDTAYIFSDGYADQLGGSSRKKMLRKRLRAYLEEASLLNISGQRGFLGAKLTEWQGHHPQTDDVLLIGVKFNHTPTL